MTELPDYVNTSVLVVGDIMLDYYIWGEVDRISPEAPIPVVHVQNRTWCLGGAGNVALNLAGLGCQTKLAGIIGKDGSGSQVKDLMATAGITDLNFCVDGFPTITKTRVMGGSQQIVRIDDEQPAHIDDTARKRVYSLFEHEISKKQVEAVVISDYGKGLFDDVLLEQCIALCSGNAVPVFIDPKRSDWKAYAGATCITPNISEFKKACDFIKIDYADLETAGRNLMDFYNLDYLLITRGSQGISLLSRGDYMYTVPAQAREVFDVSGAGDTVVALMAAGKSAGLNMKRATALANLAAGEVVARIGTYAIQKSDLIRALAREQGSRHSVSGVDLSDARKIVENWKFLGKQIVFANGCFDILHPGHVHLLQQARKLGDRLVVGLNTDDSIKRIKGPLRPVINQDDRAAILNALDCVDIVVFFSEDTPVNLISTLKPDVLVKGNDYTVEQVVGADMLEKWGGRVELVELLENNSTTGIVEKILNGKNVSFEH